jgi:anthranilate phosphoribosyltransferase
MKAILNRLFEHGSLDRETARMVLINIAKEQYNQAQIAAFLTVYLMRSITVEELAGFREALLELCMPADLGDHQVIDVCGTGGDGKDTFNISTLTSFIVAGAGYRVAKHGNYSVSSSCGSSNIMEYFGHRFTNNVDELKRQLDAAGICFLHAPLFHPAMRTVAPIRKDLGIKTFFNMLGPLVNPARPSHQLVGVFSLELARMYHYLLQSDGIEYLVLYDLNGYDEVSLTGRVKVFGNHSETMIDPEIMSGITIHSSDLKGGSTVKEAAEIFLNILQNEGSRARSEVVLVNAALAIQRFKPENPLDACLDEARNSLESGLALEAFKRIINGKN